MNNPVEELFTNRELGGMFLMSSKKDPVTDMWQTMVKVTPNYNNFASLKLMQKPGILHFSYPKFVAKKLKLLDIIKNLMDKDKSVGVSDKEALAEEIYNTQILKKKLDVLF